MDNVTYLSLSGREALNTMVIEALGSDTARIALLNDWTTFAINPAAMTITYTSQAFSTSSLVGQYVGSMAFNYQPRDLSQLVPYPLIYRDPYPTTFVKLQTYFANQYGIQLDDGELTRADGQVLSGTTAIGTVPDILTGAVTLTVNASSSRFIPGSVIEFLPIHPSVPVALSRLFTLDGAVRVMSLTDHVDTPSPQFSPVAIAGTFADAEIGVPYSSDLTLSGGDGIWSNLQVTSGTLPSWGTLSLEVVGEGYVLRLSGTPDGAAVTMNFTVTVDSGDGQTASSTQSLPVTVVTGWDPTTLLAGYVLSGSGLTCTNPTTSSPAGSVVANKPLTGKVYFEAISTGSVTPYGWTATIGVASIRGTSEFRPDLTSANYVDESQIYGAAASGYVNMSVGTGGATYLLNVAYQSNPTRIFICVDVDARKIWIGPGTSSAGYVNGGDPAAGTNPLAVAAGTGELWAICSCYKGGASVQLIVDPAQFIGTIPSGFTGGF